MNNSAIRLVALLAALALLTPRQAAAQINCANPVSGADLIVAETPSMTVFGAENGIASYSLSSTACNVGDVPALWVANTGDHPVVVQNIYRLENGRFEQIGKGWARHMFLALQQAVCCPCTPVGTGDRLGVGCSDTTSASVNGSQAIMGPRSEINGFTGEFAFPFSTSGQTGGATYKRLQVANDDVDPALHPTAEYFAETIYLSADDAGAGNGLNNASWVPLSRSGGMTGGAFRLQVAGPTRAGEPAIYAWAESEPGVVLDQIDVPGEGTFVLGSNVIDNGDGTWNYEYAVFNANSDFAAQKFSVPGGLCGLSSAPGMSFPRSHSGEPFSNAPWSTPSLGQRDFNGETYAQNPNANALRWGTTYSFYFSALCGPAPAVVDLVLFKPGNPGVQYARLEGPSDGIVSTGSYCDASPNSTGSVSPLNVSGVDMTARTMFMSSGGLPPGQFAMVLTSLSSDFVLNPGSSAGNLCLGGSIGRLVGGAVLPISFVGAVNLTVDLDMLPTPTGFTSVMPWETRYFQLWHRDVLASGAATSNFSRGLVVRFP